MKLYLLRQRERTGYDTYDSCVVAAASAARAKNITPTASGRFDSDSWASSARTVTAMYLGEARQGMPEGLVLTSFNAG